jgi:thiosulfate reductase cytochrome b subunit
MKRAYVYKRFERFWHWGQAALVIFLAVTGFEIHGSFHLFGFEKAVSYHADAAYILIGLIAFAIFWHFTTEGWRHYVPTTDKLIAQVRYYIIGIFIGEKHPTERTTLSKLNPLQRLVYLGLKLLLIPVVVTSGLAYMFFRDLRDDAGLIAGVSLESVALLHTIGAYLMLSFLVVHVYMTTTGQTPLSNTRAMITGYEDLDQETEQRKIIQ